MLYTKYIAYCKKSDQQGVESTAVLRPRLYNYKSHIKKNAHSCKIVEHFINACSDREMPFKYLAFVIFDVVNNTSGLTQNDIEDLLLEKEKCRNSTLVTEYQRLISTNDWNCSKRTKREKTNN